MQLFSMAYDHNEILLQLTRPWFGNHNEFSQVDSNCQVVDQ